VVVFYYSLYLDMEEPEKLEAIKKRLQSNASGREISPVNPRDPEELCELALRLTRSITVQAADFQRGEPLAHQDTRDIEYGSPSVDPTNPEFDAYKWARMFFRLSAEQGLGCRQAGFTFQNMTVRGTGPSVSFQHTVMSVARPFLKIRETFGPRSEKKIIRNFSGLVKRGELLIVLGRPGSGCSTLLKAITGELHNSHMSPNSIINYDGALCLVYIRMLIDLGRYYV
jgi:ATP-binding cassette subfamily G (WHITE) protein 2 (PDR)